MGYLETDLSGGGGRLKGYFIKHKLPFLLFYILQGLIIYHPYSCSVPSYTVCNCCYVTYRGEHCEHCEQSLHEVRS